ncbi:transposase [Arthrobacter celericrescens]|uniref:transposase n=1 Tax=Arthrobacter celericrescens TaxID=2320851 RepID=UPI000EA33E87|nr:transposase [Arthrobacter celericrescens]
MELSTVAAELYALLPAEFIAARGARVKEAKAAGDAGLAALIGRLPKPSAAAWAVNMLARSGAAELGELLGLGSALRDAQTDLDPARLRELGQQRPHLLAAAVGKADDIAAGLGVRLSGAATSEITGTLRAALGDMDAAAAVRSGLLVRSLSGDGVDAVDLSGAVAVEGGAVPVAPAAPRVKADDGDAGARESLRAKAEDAERAASQAEADLAEAEQSLAEATFRRRELQVALKETRERLASLEEELATAEQDARRASRAAEAADKLATQKRRIAGQARRWLERYSDDGD